MFFVVNDSLWSEKWYEIVYESNLRIFVTVTINPAFIKDVIPLFIHCSLKQHKMFMIKNYEHFSNILWNIWTHYEMKHGMEQLMVSSQGQSIFFNLWFHNFGSIGLIT